MMIEGIILAGGFSSRAGAYKLTLELGGKTVIEHCIEGMYETCSRIIVVGGYKVNHLTPILDKYFKIELVYNKNYETGMFSSVIEGLKHMKGDRIFLIPGDYALVSNDVYESLLKVKSEIVLPTYQGMNGHPVLMDKRMSNLLLSSTNYSNLREFITDQEFNTVEVKSPGILMDIDTQEDYINIKNWFGSHKSSIR